MIHNGVWRYSRMASERNKLFTCQRILTSVNHRSFFRWFSIITLRFGLLCELIFIQYKGFCVHIWVALANEQGHECHIKNPNRVSMAMLGSLDEISVKKGCCCLEHVPKGEFYHC